jgi:hypothetical protein
MQLSLCDKKDKKKKYNAWIGCHENIKGKKYKIK